MTTIGAADHHRPQSRFRLRWPEVGVALAALLVYGTFQLLAPPAWLVNDSADFVTFYLPVAESILDGNGLVDTYDRAAVRYPPGFPFLLVPFVAASRALSGDLQLWLSFLCALCFAASSALLYRLVARSTNPRLAALSAAAWMLYPPHLWLAKQPNSELPFMVLLLAALLLWQRALQRANLSWLALEAGALLGLAALFRPVAIALAVPFAVASLTTTWRPRRYRLLTATLVLVGQLAIMTPWVVWMHQQTGRWQPLSSGGGLSMLDGFTVSVKSYRTGPEVSPRVETLMHSINERRRQLFSTHAMAAYLIDYARREPATVVELMAFKAARSWFATDSLRFERWLMWLQIPLLSLAALGLIIAWRAGPRARFWCIQTVLVVAYFWLLTTIVLSILRYMLPAMLVLMPFIVVGFVRWLPGWSVASSEPDWATSEAP